MSQIVLIGDQVTFTAAASGAPTPTVQWQVSTDGGQSFVDVPGATSGSLQVTATAGSNGNQYRAVFTNTVGTATTDAATLSVTHAFLGYRTPGKRPRVNAGSTLPVAFMLGDASGSRLSDAAAAEVPTRVELWSSPTGGSVAVATCAYDPRVDEYKCVLKVPPNLASGTYYLAAQTRLGDGPWVLATPVRAAINPQSLKVV